MSASFVLAWRALVRGHVLTLLTAAVALIHWFLPRLVRGDGTADGAREMFLRAVPGSATAVTAAAILGAACGFFARDREARRLAQTVVRPAHGLGVACGAWLAFCAAGALALAFNAALTWARVGADAPDCRRYFAPDLPPPAVAATAALDDYLRDPQTPDAVRKAPRRAVLSLLANKELDRYDVVPPGGRAEWPFAADAALRAATGLCVRVRFATQFEMRADFNGAFAFGGASAAVSNVTQSILDVPLAGRTADGAAAASLTFENKGGDSVMVRPRRDLELTAPADSFTANLARATVQSFAAVALLAAFGLFLSSALSRPVAVFTAFAAVAVALLAPDAVAQFPDELGTSFADRLGLAFASGCGWLTRAFADPSPVADLAAGRCIGGRALARTLAADVLAAPAVLLSLAAVILRRNPLPQSPT